MNHSSWQQCRLSWQPINRDINDPYVRAAIANLEVEVKEEEGVWYWRRNIDDKRLFLGL